MSTAQRGFWTLLFFTLAGPFFGALGLFIALPALIQLQVGPFAGDNSGVLATAPPLAIGQIVAFSALTALRGYVWAAIPAVFAGVMFAVPVLRGWPSGWAMAGIAGVIGFMIAVILFPIMHGGLLPYLAVFAGFVAIACRGVLVRAGVLDANAAA